MGPGVALAVVGAILTFAVRAEPPGINLTVVGIILMVAGFGLIANARRGARRKRVVTRVEHPADPTAAPHTVQQTIQERDVT
jgi:ABC-type proline/glycine betaine transport system permease subunit